jgi:hypothetical protein
MKPNSDSKRIPMQPPTDNGSGAPITGAPVLEPQNHVQNALAGPGWNPYEVWWTQVRAVQLARSSNMLSPLPGEKRERKENPLNAGLSEAARKIAHLFARVVTPLKVRGVLHSLVYRRQ